MGETMVILEIRLEKPRTSIATRIQLDEAVVRWLLERADEAHSTAAEIAANVIGSIASDDMAMHSEAAPEGATLQ
jgi:hypothetical protein